MHGKRRDRYYTLRFTVDGKQIEEALVWLSDGWTLTKARIELAKLKEAKRIGHGAVTLRQARNEARKKRTESKKAKAQERATKITLDDFWISTCSLPRDIKWKMTLKKLLFDYLRSAYTGRRAIKVDKIGWFQKAYLIGDEGIGTDSSCEFIPDYRVNPLEFKCHIVFVLKSRRRLIYGGYRGIR